LERYKSSKAEAVVQGVNTLWFYIAFPDWAFISWLDWLISPWMEKSASVCYIWMDN